MLLFLYQFTIPWSKTAGLIRPPSAQGLNNVDSSTQALSDFFDSFYHSIFCIILYQFKNMHTDLLSKGFCSAATHNYLPKIFPHWLSNSSNIKFPHQNSCRRLNSLRRSSRHLLLSSRRCSHLPVQNPHISIKPKPANTRKWLCCPYDNSPASP